MFPLKNLARKGLIKIRFWTRKRHCLTLPHWPALRSLLWVFLRKLTLLFGDSNVAWNTFISRILLHLWFRQRSTKPWYASWWLPTRFLLPIRLCHPSGLPTGNLQRRDGATSSQWMFKLYWRPVLPVLQYDSDRNWLWCRWGRENSLWQITQLLWGNAFLLGLVSI